MGVRGLQTFLKENRQSLCRSLVLDAAGAAARPRVPVVVDAWGIIYQLYLDALPWASGGEYLQFFRLVRRLVKAWRAVGLEPVFVFDGASPPEKHATLLGRMQQSVETARLFYTTRPESRSSPAGQRGGNSILPPFTSQTFGAALSSLGVETRFVPRGEADGVCVVMAATLGGYVMGRDTDFVILASGAEGPGERSMKGYIPLDMIEWVDSSPPSGSSTPLGGGFTTVSGSRSSRRKRPPSRLLPPSKGCTLILPTFTAAALARRLRLPVAMLPLLASLVGNDFSQGTTTNGGKPADRIDRIARTLRETQTRPGSHHADTAFDLVTSVVRKLHTGPWVDEREVAETVDGVVDATIQYVLPPAPCCEAYPFCGELDMGCSGASRQLSRAATPETTPRELEDNGEAVAMAYAKAQAAGHLNLATHAWLHPDRVYLWGVLENPAGPSARAATIPTAARTAAYTILDAALGLRWPALSEEEQDQRRQDREAADLLAGLALEPSSRADADGDGDEPEGQVAGGEEEEDVEASGPEDAPPEQDNEPSHVVTEYLRQGSSARIRSRDLPLPPRDVAETPLPLLSLEARLAAYREALDAPDSVGSLPSSLQPLACALRTCILTAAETDPTGQAGRRWRRAEVEAVARAAIGSAEMWRTEVEAAQAELAGAATGAEDAGEDKDEADAEAETEEDNFPLLSNRSAELVAQFSAALLDTLALGQALLLTPDCEGATHLTPQVFVSGAALHRLLAGEEPRGSWHWSAAWKHKLHRVLAAVFDGTEEALAAVVSPKRRKKKLAGGAGGATGARSGGVKAAGGGGGRFDLLLGEGI